MDFEIISTNIAAYSADAIVLPANSKLKEGSGASTAIFKAAGRIRLAKACNKIGFCEMGFAVPTAAYDLDADFIIHTVVPKWIDGEHNEYELLCSAYLSALKLADYLKCESIAFPLLASGNNKFNFDLAFEIAKQSFDDFNGENLKKITLVLYGDRVVSTIRAKGYDVIVIPENLESEKKKAEKSKKWKQHWDTSKEIAGDYIDDIMTKAEDFMSDPENRKKILNAAGIILVKAIKAAQEQ